MISGDWTDHEDDFIVADYFAMLELDLLGGHYNKADHNRQWQSQTGCGRSSIEFKHQNISAVLKGLGEIWILGYKPAVNFQMSLVDAVLRWLGAHPAWSVRLPSLATPRSMYKSQPLWFDPPPDPSEHTPTP
jgi:hypothetical protein